MANNYKGSKKSQSKQNYKGSSSKNKGYYKKKPYNKAEDTESKSEQKISDYVGSENDPKWYNRNSRLVQDASKISFANQLGAPLLFQTFGDTLDADLSAVPIPGIFALHMVNVPGIAITATDGVNIAAAGLFQYIRKNLSTVASYAPADVMAVTLAIDEVYSMYANITRVFGIINAYSAINLYLPNKLLEAGYGFSEAEVNIIKSSINDYRSRFNNLIFKASTLYLPTDFTVTSRHAWLYSNYFTDADSVKAQIYIHRMLCNHIFDETTYETGSALATAYNSSTLHGLLDRFDAMIDALRNSDSALKIQADMRRAFENRSQWRLAYVDEAFMTLPKYSEEVLNQINNTNILPGLSNPEFVLSRLDVTQDVNHNIMQFAPFWQWATIDAMNKEQVGTATYLSSSKVLNFFKDEISTDDICEATRNVVACTVDVQIGVTLSVIRCGVDLCVGAKIYLMDDNVTVYQCSAPITDGNANQLVNLAKFDWSPIVLAEVLVEDELSTYEVASDLGNYSIVDTNTIVRLHDNILCSMWSVPELGSYMGQ